MGVDITKELISHFEVRTKYHIETVQFYAKLLADRYESKYGKGFSQSLLESVSLHDASKYWSEERTGYILMSFKYQDEENHTKLFSDEDNRIMDEAWEHHQLHNTHHPEHYDEVNDMPLDQIAHMCADWAAVSEEVNDNILKWYTKTIPTKYKFNITNQMIITMFCQYLFPIITKRQLNRINTDKVGEFGEE